MLLSGLVRLVGAAMGAARAWFEADRIRASPREGILLRLRPPAIVRVRGKTLEVTSRRVVEGPPADLVCYGWSGPDGRAGELLVVPLPRAAVLFLENGAGVPLAEDEVEVVGNVRRRGSR